MEEIPRTRRFVEYVLKRKQEDTGFAAKLRRADNEDTEDQSWGILARFGVDLENDRQRLPHALIGSALCRSEMIADGTSGIGAVLASCFDGEDVDGKQPPGAARMRRLLACDSTKEVCRTLRPLLRLIEGKAKRNLCYADLLQELIYFESASADRTKKRWAMDFYRRNEDNPEDNNGDS